jgi:hypothetical protein
MSGNGEDETEFKPMEAVAFLAALGAGAIIFFSVVALLYSIIKHFNGWPDVITNHFPVVVGLPVGATLAFMIVSVLRQVDGPIEFEGLGFKFKGASGQVVMWVVCFLAIAAAIHWCWGAE